MGKEGYTISSIYQGGYSSLDPAKSYGDVFTGYRVAAGELGLTTDPRTANILKDASAKLSTGIKTIELSMIQPEVFESIPKQHLKEVNRLTKLTGTDITIHGPLVEASGLTREGFNESFREAAERQMDMVIDRSHEINPDGNSPVTFHSSVVLPGEIVPEGKKTPEQILVINTDSGEINRIPIKERYFPGETGKPDIEKEISSRNEEIWGRALTHLGYNTEKAGELIESSGYLKLIAESEKRSGKELTPEKKQARQIFDIGQNYLKDSYRELKELYELANKHGTAEDKEKLEKLNKEIQIKVDEINKNKQEPLKNLALMRDVIEKGHETLSEISPPKLYEPLTNFARDKSTTTFANVAWNAYNKFKDKAPIISIENPPIGSAFSTGEELKQFVDEAKNKFVEKAKKEGLSEKEAKREADKLLGVTWDVGHINMLKKHGYTDEDILKHTEKVAPLVKHIHISDNFGFEHTELPIGMGNVPFKEIMKKLGQKGFEAKKIIEAGNWWQHFQTPPVSETLEALGSPVYAMKMGPYWNQIPGFYQGYFGGYGLMLPQFNYETFGAGFSQLPAELGGQRAGAQGSRISGKPME